MSVKKKWQQYNWTLKFLRIRDCKLQLFKKIFSGITSDSTSILPSTSILHQVKDQKKDDEISQSYECSDDSDMGKCEEYSQQKDAAKSSLESKTELFNLLTNYLICFHL